MSKRKRRQRRRRTSRKKKNDPRKKSTRTGMCDYLHYHSLIYLCQEFLLQPSLLLVHSGTSKFCLLEKPKKTLLHVKRQPVPALFTTEAPSRQAKRRGRRKPLFQPPTILGCTGTTSAPRLAREDLERTANLPT